MAGAMVEQAPVDLDLIEARAEGIGNADVIFVFGTLHPTPAHVAAEELLRAIGDGLLGVPDRLQDRCALTDPP